MLLWTQEVEWIMGNVVPSGCIIMCEPSANWSGTVSRTWMKMNEAGIVGNKIVNLCTMGNYVNYCTFGNCSLSEHHKIEAGIMNNIEMIWHQKQMNNVQLYMNTLVLIMHEYCTLLLFIMFTYEHLSYSSKVLKTLLLHMKNKCII